MEDDCFAIKSRTTLKLGDNEVELDESSVKLWTSTGRLAASRSAIVSRFKMGIWSMGSLYATEQKNLLTREKHVRTETHHWSTQMAGLRTLVTGVRVK